MNTKHVLLSICLLSCFFCFPQKKQKLSKNKKAILASVEDHKAELIKIADEIWANAELAFEEYKSAKILADYAEKNGFKVERGVAGMPTAL